MAVNRWGTVSFLLFLTALAVWLNWNYWRNRVNATPTETLERQIVADLSNLPPEMGEPDAPIIIEVTLYPRYAGPCDKGTVEFVRQLVRDYPGKVRARFQKLERHERVECAAHLTINGKRTFQVRMEDKPVQITLHGIARPGDPMSYLVRRIVEQEIAKSQKGVKDAKTEAVHPAEVSLR